MSCAEQRPLLRVRAGPESAQWLAGTCLALDELPPALAAPLRGERQDDAQVEILGIDRDTWPVADLQRLSPVFRPSACRCCGGSFREWQSADELAFAQRLLASTELSPQRHGGLLVFLALLARRAEGACVITIDGLLALLDTESIALARRALAAFARERQCVVLLREESAPRMNA